MRISNLWLFFFNPGVAVPGVVVPEEGGTFHSRRRRVVRREPVQHVLTPEPARVEARGADVVVHRQVALAAGAGVVGVAPLPLGVAVARTVALDGAVVATVALAEVGVARVVAAGGTAVIVSVPVASLPVHVMVPSAAQVRIMAQDDEWLLWQEAA
jgi:hypothetical protein